MPQKETHLYNINPILQPVRCLRMAKLMGMGIKCGDTVTVRIEGADEDTAAPAMEKFFSEHL